MKTNKYYLSWEKRAFDLLLAIIVSLLLAPLLPFMYLTLILTIGSPIIFKQKRFGKNKKPFIMYKLRTMHLNAGKKQKTLHKDSLAPSPMFKIYDDPRFIGIGKKLSQLGLDEIPQLINIIKGDMSFVGPRPLPVKEAVLLKSDWDYRYAVKPGVLSFWAISPNRYDSLTKWKKLEKETLKIDSIVKDSKLILKTIHQIIIKKKYAK